jgi:membrane-bound lytic murein transglycosylase MltF
METDQLRQLFDQLERDVVALIAAFEEQTRAEIAEIQIDRSGFGSSAGWPLLILRPRLDPVL